MSAALGAGDRARARARGAWRVARLLALASLSIAGCEVDPYCLDCNDAGPGDASIDAGRDAQRIDAEPLDGGPDTGPPDAGPELPDGCAPGAVERCNEFDDDCDLRIDEGIETSSDPMHCGRCNRPCAPAHAIGVCMAGECSFTECDVGYYDENGDPADGCEYRCVTTDPDDARCDLRDNDCDGTVDEDVVFDTDPANCGSCGRTCRFAHAIGACTAGACVLGACDVGFADADGNPANGCEYGCVPASPATETCNLRDDDCDGTIDEGNPGGGATCGITTGACETGLEACVGGAITCTGGVSPSAELCNGLDDNCDGAIDEANPEGGRLCGTGTGVCEPGREVCTAGALSCTGATGPALEACNGLDDDCDGTIDDGDPGGGGACGTEAGDCVAGVQHCRGGVIACEGVIGPAIEVCDGRDNDCDGAIDDGNPGAGGACGTDTGACVAGTRQCTGGMLVCTGGTGPIAEACNSLDDDCDGRIDEMNPGGGAACGVTTGECSAGVQTCVGGALTCVGGTGPVTEICNGLDDDCDGMNDDGNPGGGGSCGTDVGACNPGTRSCTSGMLVCTGSVGPVVESCNAIDDDCDSNVDEMNPGGGAACGSSVGDCEPGVRTCVAGAFTCVGQISGGPEVCDTRDNDCDGTTDEGFMTSSDVNNCGMCGRVCSFPFAIERCTAGVCGILACETGHYDLDGMLANGCEYACDVAGAEACNGRDDDCDGVIDDGVTAPPMFCNPNGVCAGTTPSCGGASGWVCTYPMASYQAIETRCDDLDNDCDGAVDEPFPTKGAACDNMRQGICRTTGTFACNALGTGVTCNAAAGPPAGTETCDNRDEDCDGRLDEGSPAQWVQFTSGGATRWIMAYEASRPDATSMAQGSTTHRACSRPMVLPWTNLTHDQAEAACATHGATTRLCTETEWRDACRTGAGTPCRWSESSTCTTYNAGICNGNDYDPIPATMTNEDMVLATGSLPMCYADWPMGDVFDMSGNVEEWTVERTPAVNPIRGGSINDTEGGMECDFNFVVAGETFLAPTVGFRCCRTTMP